MKLKISTNTIDRPPSNYTGTVNQARLARAMTAKGIVTPAQLAAQMESWYKSQGITGRSPATWRRIMDGDVSPEYSGAKHGARSVLLDIADALGVSVEWLLCEDVVVGS